MPLPKTQKFSARLTVEFNPEAIQIRQVAPGRIAHPVLRMSVQDHGGFWNPPLEHEGATAQVIRVWLADPSTLEYNTGLRRGQQPWKNRLGSAQVQLKAVVTDGLNAIVLEVAQHPPSWQSLPRIPQSVKTRSHVRSCDPLAIVKPGIRPQAKSIDQPIVRHAP